MGKKFKDTTSDLRKQFEADVDPDLADDEALYEEYLTHIHEGDMAEEKAKHSRKTRYQPLVSKNVEALYKAMYGAGKIKCTQEDFCCHFTSTENKLPPIKFYGKPKELTDSLYADIQNGHIWQVVAQHFVDKDGRRYNPNTLGTTNNR